MADWSVTSANVWDNAAHPVTLTIAGVSVSLTSDEAASLSDALLEAHEHQGHDGDCLHPMDCSFCSAVVKAEGIEWGKVFGVLDEDGNETGKRLPHRGDPDFPEEGTCSDCGPGHIVDPLTGRCADECDSCEVARGDGDYFVFPCVRDRIYAAADDLRKAAK